MRSVRTPLLATVLVGLLTSSAIAVAVADDDVPDGAEEVLLGVNPKWVADHPDPNSLDFEEGVSLFTLYEHPDRPGMLILPDEPWCQWVSSYLNDDDGHATGRGIQACLENIVDLGGYSWTVVPATFAEDILDPPFYESPADGSVIRRGEGEEDSGPFLLEGHVDYRVDIEAPPDCPDFSVWLRPQGAPEWERRTLADGDIVEFDGTGLSVWDISTPCEGRWNISIGEDGE